MLKHAFCHRQQKQKAAELQLINHFLRQKDCLGNMMPEFQDYSLKSFSHEFTQFPHD